MQQTKFDVMNAIMYIATGYLIQKIRSGKIE